MIFIQEASYSLSYDNFIAGFQVACTAWYTTCYSHNDGRNRNKIPKQMLEVDYGKN